jgi:hypothetical protein
MSSIDVSRPPRPALPALVRIALLCGAWLPFLGLLLFILPKFGPIFSRLAAKGELPALTSWLVAVERFNSAAFGLPILAFFAWLIVFDLGLAALVRDLRRGRLLYWGWFVAMILLALFACLLFVVAVNLPVFKMSSTIG